MTNVDKHLRRGLQSALELEHATIPAYLCALYSIDEDANVEAARLIHSVVMEEMLHMVLVANIMNALGLEPSVDHEGFVPQYPTRLPYSDGRLKVRLLPFSREAIELFREIERPEPKKAKPRIKGYDTIGQLYAGIEEALRDRGNGPHAYPGDPGRQIGPNHFYYGGGGEPIRVHDRKTALEALHEIVRQGEGSRRSIRDGGHHLGEGGSLAHYYRFDEIHRGRHYRKGDTHESGPTGAPLAVDWGAAHRMRKDPRASTLPRGSDERELAVAFNHRYADLLHLLHRAFNGEPHLLQESVPVMIDLKWRAVSLMRVPVRGSGRRTAGPSFEWPPPRR